MRLFFALWPPKAAAGALGAWAREVQAQAGGRATAEETIHLTLAFLGVADPEQAAAVARQVRGASFDLPVDACKYWKQNRIVWAGPREAPRNLSRLAARLQIRLKRSGFALEERPFAAHVTLVRRASMPEALPPLPPVEWHAGEFVLVRSRAPRYEVLERFALRP